jgi:acyl-CoA thioesterase-1
MRILVFGDSITQGYFDVEGGWVGRLRREFDQLRENGTKTYPPVVFNLGVSGDTSQEVAARIDNETRARLWPGEEMVIVLNVGVNDARIDGTRPFSTPEQYRQNLEWAIETARKYSQKILIVGLSPCVESLTTPVDWSVDKISWTNQRIQEFDRAAKEAAATNKLPFVDVMAPFQAQLAKHDLLPDGLHPNSNGHQVIAGIVGTAFTILVSG